MEPDERYFRRRASEELAAARRAVTDEARERRLTLAGVFLDRLKAVALVRNRGIALDGLTTVNLDFIRHYRPMTNVVHRPTAGVGKGYSLVGHHELLIPLLAALLVDGDR